MGNFRIEIEAVGGHGCSRNFKDGEKVFGCRRMDCPDCLTREFVEKLNSKMSVSSATFTHWPGQPVQVVDDLLTGIRKGSF